MHLPVPFPPGPPTSDPGTRPLAPEQVGMGYGSWTDPGSRWGTSAVAGISGVAQVGPVSANWRRSRSPVSCRLDHLLVRAPDWLWENRYGSIRLVSRHRHSARVVADARTGRRKAIRRALKDAPGPRRIRLAVRITRRGNEHLRPSGRRCAGWPSHRAVGTVRTTFTELQGRSRRQPMATGPSRLRPLAAAVVFFLLVTFFQLLFEWVFGHKMDARCLFQVVLASAIMTALFTLFTWRRTRWRARPQAVPRWRSARHRRAPCA